MEDDVNTVPTCSTTYNLGASRASLCSQLPLHMPGLAGCVVPGTGHKPYAGCHALAQHVHDTNLLIADHRRFRGNWLLVVNRLEWVRD